MPRLFVALPVPEEIANDLLALQSGVPDARWIAPENFHVTLCFAGEVHGAMMRDFEEELSDITGPRFAVALAGVEQFSSGKQPRALVATVERSDRLTWLQQKVSTVARYCGIEVERRKFRPHVTLARFPNGAETGHHLAQFMASHSTFRAGPWIAEHFALYSSRSSRSGRIYTEEAGYGLSF
jgi:2'-5' RNA ligase